MKLTKAQIAALSKVMRGEVTFLRGVRKDYVTGAKQDTIKRLLEKGFIAYPKLTLGYANLAYILTDAGRAALKSARQKEGK